MDPMKGRDFQRWRRARKVSQEDLADRIGIARHHILGVEATLAVVEPEWLEAVLDICRERAEAAS